MLLASGLLMIVAIAIMAQRGIPTKSLNGAQLADIGFANGTGNVIAMPQYASGTSSGFSWQTQIVGGPPATVNVVLEGNNVDPTDPTQWQLVDTATNVAGELRFVDHKPPRWLRIRLTAIGAGGGAVSGFIQP